MASSMRSILLPFISSLLLFTLGCGDGWVHPFARLKAKRTYQGSANIALPYLPLMLDPLGADYLQQEGLLRQLFPTLLVPSQGAEGRITYGPGLASSWEIAPDGLSVSFVLDEDALWSDGVPMGAEDVVVTLRLQKEPTLAFPLRGLKSAIRGVEVVGENALRFDLRTPVPDPLRVINAGVIIPAHNMADRRAETDPPFLGVTGGPYMVRGGRRIFRRGRKRFESSLPMALVPDPKCETRVTCPKLGEVILSAHPTMADRLGLLLEGGIDYLPGLPIAALNEISGRPDLRLTASAEATLTVLSWNTTDPSLTSPKVRRALSRALDPAAIINGPLRGTAQAWAPLTSPAQPKAQANVSTLLKRAGFVDEDDDGWLELEGEPYVLELLFEEGNPTQEGIAQLVRDHLRRIGVQTLLRGLPGESLLRRGEGGEFQGILMDWSIGGRGSLKGVAWVANHFGGQLNGVESGLRALDKAPNDDAWSQAAVQLFSTLEQDAPLVVLAERHRLDASNDRLLGLGAPASAYGDLHTWHIATPETVDGP